MSAGKEADSPEMARAHSAISAEQVRNVSRNINTYFITGITKLILFNSLMSEALALRSYHSAKTFRKKCVIRLDSDTL